MKIMVFLHGTAIMHLSGLGKTREERVLQVRQGDESVLDFAAYVPVDGVVRKLQAWRAQGADVVYRSSHRTAADVAKARSVLVRHGFPEGTIFHRRGSESYADVAARVTPDVLIEDDCESIGGRTEMTYPHLEPELKAKIKSIVVKEFAGLDALPDDIHDLLKVSATA